MRSDPGPLPHDSGPKVMGSDTKSVATKEHGQHLGGLEGWRQQGTMEVCKKDCYASPECFLEEVSPKL